VAPGVTDEKDLKDKFRTAFKASKTGQDLFKAGVFDAIRLHALTDYVSPGEVLTRLSDIGDQLKGRAVQGFSSDVVLVYFWGRQSDAGGDNYLWTSETEPGAVASTSLKLRELRDRYFARFAGAQVLLLDLYPDKQGATAKAFPQSDYRFCILGLMSPERPSFAPLLGQLEKNLPNVTWLDEVVPPLKSLASFSEYQPPGLRIQLQPGASSLQE
jgi:hypothetical protein